MKKGRFLWSAHRITERQKAGKARNIKGKQLKNSRNTVLKQLVELLSSQKDNQIYTAYQLRSIYFGASFCDKFRSGGYYSPATIKFFVYTYLIWRNLTCVFILHI